MAPAGSTPKDAHLTMPNARGHACTVFAGHSFCSALGFHGRQSIFWSLLVAVMLSTPAMPKYVALYSYLRNEGAKQDETLLEAGWGVLF